MRKVLVTAAVLAISLVAAQSGSGSTTTTVSASSAPATSAASTSAATSAATSSAATSAASSAATSAASSAATSAASSAATSAASSAATSAASSAASSFPGSISSSGSIGSSGSGSGIYDPFPDRHILCYNDVFSETLWRIEILPDINNLTVISKTTPNETASGQYAVLFGPQPESWPEGVSFARAMQQQGLFPLTNPVEFALWTRDPFTRIDFMWFNATNNDFGFPLPEIVLFASTACPDWFNCYAAVDGLFGAHCYYDNETCCGNNTAILPTCVSNDNGDQCCAFEAGAASCKANETCCGGFGTLAFCCEAGSTCCTAANASSGISSCCSEGSVCCQGSLFGLCCASGEQCDADNNRCNIPGVPTLPTIPPVTLPPFTLPTTPSFSSQATSAASAVGSESATASASGVTSAGSAPAQAIDVLGQDNSTNAPPPPVSTYLAVIAQLTLSGNGWQNVQNGAGGVQWTALQQALRNDLANALNVNFGDVNIISLQASASSLFVNYSVAVSSNDAAAKTLQAAQLSQSALNLQATSVVYLSANPGTSSNITATSSSATTGVLSSPAWSQPVHVVLVISALSLAAALLWM